MNINKQAFQVVGILLLGLMMGISLPTTNSVAGLPESADVLIDFGRFHGFVLGGTELEHEDQITLGLATRDSVSLARLENPITGPTATTWRGRILKDVSGLGDNILYEAVFVDDRLIALQLMPLFPPRTVTEWFNTNYGTVHPIEDISNGSFLRTDQIGNELRLEESQYREDGRAFLEFRWHQWDNAPPTDSGLII